jgi:DNA-binding beta-propeller fold protein YncE
VHIFDVASERLWKKYTLNDGTKHLFNDIVITREGVGYVSDSNGGGIYRIRTDRDTVESFIAGGTLRYPNGIALSPDEKKLLVSTGSGIVSIDIGTKSVSPLPHDKFVLIGTDGLYTYGNSLIGIQNVTFPESILEYRCNSDFSAITAVIPKALNHPGFDTPTTGVIVGNQFFFIANSQLLQVVGAGGGIKNPEALKESIIMKLRLD